MKTELKDIVAQLPNKPGVYQYFDQQGVIIYVGKAKNLKKRVQSYFNRDAENGKTRLLVKRIVDIKYIVVETEYDALLLENNLIKKYQPKYNIQLKDDKTYPWICIKKEPFPRVFSTRRVVKDGSTYFGPYASGRMLHTLLEFIKDLFPLRNCNLSLTAKNIESEKFKVCLEYHLGNCLGPCVGKQSEESYQSQIDQISKILKGHLSTVQQYLKEKMNEAATDLNFEMAQRYKERIEVIKNYQSKSTVVSVTIKNVDVFGIIQQDQKYVVNYLKVVDGAIIRSHSMVVKNPLEEPLSAVLLAAIVDLKERFDSDAKEVLTSVELEDEIPGVQFKTPQRGDRKKLVELSLRNAKYFLLDQKRDEANLKQRIEERDVLNRMQKDLRLKERPVRIECFDNSNIQGTNPVAACVVFKNGKPANKEYRHFKIKTVDGPNDFASMEEVVYRRYKRMLEEGTDLPQLIVIDGGKGQLSSAVEALRKLDIYSKIAIVGIAKRLEEIYYPGDSAPLYLDKSSPSLKVIQHIRNEAHRFGITFHRQLRSKNAIVSELDQIKGIGPSTVKSLLTTFKSVANIKQQKLTALEEAIGKAKAKTVYEYFQNAQ